MRPKKRAVPKKPEVFDDPAGLRRRAEVRVHERRGDRKAGAGDPRMFHELEVHQVELEMQNAELHRARNELEAALERYTDLYDFAPVGYLSVDEAGAILAANLTGATMLGVERSRLINRRLPLLVSAEDRPAFLAFLESTFAGSGTPACEARLRREDGGTQWAGFRANSAVGLKGTRKWCRIVFEDITARRQAEEARREVKALSEANRQLSREIVRRQEVEKSLQKSQREQALLLEQAHAMHLKLRHMTHRVFHAHEEERKRISRELHDEVAQMLVGVNLRLAALNRDAAGRSKGFRQQLAKTQRLVDHSVEAVQRFARDLRPKALDDLGLVPALSAFLRQFAKQTGVRTRLKASEGTEQLSVAQRTVFYRVAQEALTNVARHAKAGRVEVRIEKHPDRICMTITDDGRSFRTRRVMRSRGTKHLGLVGMHERLQMLGGDFGVESAAGKGTTITAEIPLGKAAPRIDR